MNLFNIISRIAAQFKYSDDYLTMDQRNEIIRKFYHAGHPQTFTMYREGPGIYEGNIGEGTILRVQVLNGEFVDIQIGGKKVSDIDQAVKTYKELSKLAKPEPKEQTGTKKRPIKLNYSIQVMNKLNGKLMILKGSLGAPVSDLKDLLQIMVDELNKLTGMNKNLQEIINYHNFSGQIDYYRNAAKIIVKIIFVNEKLDTIHFPDAHSEPDFRKINNIIKTFQIFGKNLEHISGFDITSPTLDEVVMPGDQYEKLWHRSDKDVYVDASDNEYEIKW